MTNPTTFPTIEEILATPRPECPNPEASTYSKWDSYEGPAGGDIILVRYRDPQDAEAFVWVPRRITISASGKYMGLEGESGRWMRPHRRTTWSRGAGPDAHHQFDYKVRGTGGVSNVALAFPWEAEKLGDSPVIHPDAYETLLKQRDLKAKQAQDAERAKGYRQRTLEFIQSTEYRAGRGPATRFLYDYKDATWSFEDVQFLARLLDAALEDRERLMGVIDGIKRDAERTWGFASRSELESRLLDLASEAQA